MGGRDSIDVQLSVRTPTVNGVAVAETTDPSTWDLENDGVFFRDGMGDIKYLVPTVTIGGEQSTFDEHNTYMYLWTKNGLAFTPSISGALRTVRVLRINSDDVQDSVQDQFQCVVRNIPDS